MPTNVFIPSLLIWLQNIFRLHKPHNYNRFRLVERRKNDQMLLTQLHAIIYNALQHSAYEAEVK